jgi:uncharacterized lipoprotein YbaY
MKVPPAAFEGTAMRARIFSAAKWSLSILAVGVLLGCGPSGGTTRIAGTVTYREKFALPEHAAVDVRLEDSAAPSTPVAQQTIDTQGRQVPIPFALEVERGALKADRHYIVRAVIRTASGEVLFTTPPDQQALENPNTSGRIEISLERAPR